MKPCGMALTMAVISVSLPDEVVDGMDAAIARDDYKGRSEYVRAAVRHYLQDRDRPRGKHVHGSVTIVYAHGKEARISDVRHAFHDVVLSMMHTHCEPELCMDVMIIGGAPTRVQDLVETLERMREVERCRLVTVG